jgi:RNA polymerase sigma-70 factor (ECF subfamily)
MDDEGLELQRGDGGGAGAAPPPHPLEFKAVYEEEFDYVWDALRSLGIRERDLEDLTHDVFVKVFHRFATYDQTRPLRPWLFGVAFRVASDFRRLARHQREAGSSLYEPADRGSRPDALAAARQELRLVLRALDTLDLDRRAVFVMHELNDHSMREISETLAVPLSTLYDRLRSARTEFSAAVRRLLRGEPA